MLANAQIQDTKIQGSQFQHSLNHTLYKIRSHLTFKSLEQPPSNYDLPKVISILSQQPGLRTSAELKGVHRFFQMRIAYMQELTLKDEMLLALFRSITIEKLDPYQVLFYQGDTGRKMYIVLEGEVAIMAKNLAVVDASNTNQQKIKRPTCFEDFIKLRLPNHTTIAVKRQFEHFGEIAIEQRIPRTASAITKCETTLAVLTYEAYQQILQQVKEQMIRFRSGFLGEIFPFSELSFACLHQVLHTSEEVVLPSNCTIYKKGQRADNVFVIISGDVLVQRWEKLLDSESLNHAQSPKTKLVNHGLYSRGSIVGDLELYIHRVLKQELVRCSQAITKGPVKALRIGVEQMANMFQEGNLYRTLIHFLNKKYGDRLCSPAKTEEEEKPQKRIDLQLLRPMKNDLEEMKFLKLIGLHVDSKYKPKPRVKQNLLKQSLDLRDKSIYKYLRFSQGLIKISTPVHQENPNSTSVEGFARRLKQKLRLNKECDRLSDSHLVSFALSAKHIQIDSDSTSFRLTTNNSTSPKSKQHQKFKFSKLRT